MICPICRREVERVVVDHCHATNVIRGEICSACNIGLGHFRDDIQTLLGAIAYLMERGQVVTIAPLPDRLKHVIDFLERPPKADGLKAAPQPHGRARRR